MDGRGRWLDNRFIERLWWSAKHEDIYRQDYGDGLAAGRGLAQWFTHYNTQRPHQSLDNATPAQWYFSPEDYGGAAPTWEARKPPRSALRRRTAGTARPIAAPSDPQDF
jgi:putative transposase